MGLSCTIFELAAILSYPSMFNFPVDGVTSFGSEKQEWWTYQTVKILMCSC